MVERPSTIQPVVSHPSVDSPGPSAGSVRKMLPAASWAAYPGTPTATRSASSSSRRGPGARARADPLRADVGLAVHLLPRGGGDHGRGPRDGRRAPGCGCSSAATPTWRTSACSPPRSARSSSTSTTSTRHCPGRSSGTSSGSRPASRSPAATAASRRRPTATSCARGRARLPRGDGASSPRWATSTSGTPASTPTTIRRRSGGEVAAEVQCQASSRTSAKARTQTACRRSSKLTEDVEDGEPQLRQRPAAARARSTSSPSERDRDAARRPGSHEAVPRLPRAPSSRPPPAARAYRFVDLARKVVGVGSVGTRCWIAAAASAATTATRCSCRSRRPSRRCSSRTSARAAYRNHGQRVVEGQRLMQAASDIFLGWDARHRARRRPTATSTSASCGTGRLGRHRRRCARRARRLRRGLRLDAGPGARPLAATGSPSPPTSAAATPSTRRSPTSPRAYADQNERDHAAKVAAWGATAAAAAATA